MYKAPASQERGVNTAKTRTQRHTNTDTLNTELCLFCGKFFFSVLCVCVCVFGSVHANSHGRQTRTRTSTAGRVSRETVAARCIVCWRCGDSHVPPATRALEMCCGWWSASLRARARAQRVQRACVCTVFGECVGVWWRPERATCARFWEKERSERGWVVLVWGAKVVRPSTGRNKDCSCPFASTVLFHREGRLH